MQILYNDVAVNGTLSSFNLDALTSIDNLIDPRLSRSSRFTYFDGIIITLTFDLPQTIDAVGVGGTDLTDAATITVNGVTATQTSRNGNFFMPLAAEVTDTDFTITLLDTGTTNGAVINIGRLMAGTLYQAPGINDNVTLDYIVETDRQFSASRQVYGQSLVNYQSIFVQLPVIEQTDKPDMMAFQDAVMDFKPFFLNFDEPCFDEGPFYVILGGSNEFGYQLNGAHFWTLGLTFEEVY